MLSLVISLQSATFHQQLDLPWVLGDPVSQAVLWSIFIFFSLYVVLLYVVVSYVFLSYVFLSYVFLSYVFSFFLLVACLSFSSCRMFLIVSTVFVDFSGFSLQFVFFIHCCIQDPIAQKRYLGQLTLYSCILVACRLFVFILSVCPVGRWCFSGLSMHLFRSIILPSQYSRF